MSADETSDSRRSRRRRGRLVVGIVGWAVLAACVVPLQILLIAFVASYLGAPGVLGPPTVADPVTYAAVTAVVSAVIIGVGTLGLVLVTASRTGPAVGRLARPRRTLRTYLLDLAAASLLCFGAALAIDGSWGAPDPLYADVGTWLASALLTTIDFIVVPIAAVAGIVWSIEHGRGRPLPRPVLVVVAAGFLIGWLALQLLVSWGDPTSPPWSTAALAAVQLGAFVYSRSAAAVVIPQLAIGPALASLPALETDAGFGAGTLALGLAMAVATRVRVRVVDLGRAP